MLRRVSAAAGVLGAYRYSYCDSKQQTSDAYVLPGLKNKVAVVSAGAQGIGRGICLCLAEQGAHVVLADLPSQRALAEETVRMIEELGSTAVFVAADGTDREQIEAVFAHAHKTHGSIDVSVSVLGGGPRGPFLEQDPGSHEKTVALTQHSHWHWQQVAAQYMCQPSEPFAAPTGGKIVLIGSIMGEMSVEGCLSYQTSKAAVATMGKCLANELAPFGVRVNVLQPGYIDTPGERVFSTEAALQEWPRTYKVPAERIGTPRDIGMAVAFLCSDASAYITGAVLSVDGGYLAAMALPKRTELRTDRLRDGASK
jgi:glucose 1-dehydrogenase